MAADLGLPVRRHHAAVLLVVLDAGEIEPVELDVEAVLLGGRLERAHAFGRHFLADAVAGYDRDAIGLLQRQGSLTRRFAHRNSPRTATESNLPPNGIWRPI